MVHTKSFFLPLRRYKGTCTHANLAEMGRGDFPTLVRQWSHSCVEMYRSSSLYHRNLGFFFVGILGGSVLGVRQRKANEARNADCASVRLTFYELPPAARTQQRDSETPQTQQEHKNPQLPASEKRSFERLWGEAARLLQRQPGYTYTLMFRRIISAECASELEKQQQAGTELERYRSGPRGVGADLEAADGGTATQQDPQEVDYVEMRVWESDELHQKAQAIQAPLLQKMQKLGVGINAGLYRRVFDDALVRLIQ